MTVKTKDEEEAELKALFKSYDKNGDGHLSRQEMMAVFKATGQDWCEADLNIMFDEVDTDKSGTIEYAEYVAWLMAGSDDEGEEGEPKKAGEAQRASILEKMDEVKQ